MASLQLSPDNVGITRQGGTDNFFATWSLTSAQNKQKISKKVYDSKKKKKVKTTKKYPDVIDSYTIKWYYQVSINSDSTWYLDKTITGAKGSNTSTDLWSPPSNARQIMVTVEPISKTYKSSSSKESKWFNVASTPKVDTDYNTTPSAPSISDFKINGKTLSANVVINMSDVDRLETSAVRLQVLKNSTEIIQYGGQYYLEKRFSPSSPLPSSGIVVFAQELTGVGSYQVRGAVAAYDDGYKWSEYSSWSSSVDTRPNPPTIIKIEAVGDDKVKLTWGSVETATKYTIEYVSDSTSYFDSGAIQSVSLDNVTSYIVTGLEAGHVWYFRVRSENGSDKSSPSNVVSIVIATKPSPPTTWSSLTTASIKSTLDTTDPLYLYWIHNSLDGSAQRSAKFEFEIGGSRYYLLWTNTEKDDYGELLDSTCYIELWGLTVYTTEGSNTTSAGKIYDIFKSKGAESIKWKVRTKGIHADYSDWSIERTINAYEQPNLQLIVCDANGDEFPGNTVTSFPICVKGIVTPSSQTPISFHVSIVSNSSYNTTDIHGDTMVISNGTEIYSRYLDTDKLDYQITAADVDFVSGVSYLMTVIVYTNVGLTAEATYTFAPSWEEQGVEPQALFDYNEKYRYVDITPSCSYFIGYEPDENAGLDDYEPVAYIGTVITGETTEPKIFSGSGIENAVTGDMYFNKSTYEVYVCVDGGNASTATWHYRTTFKYEDAVTWYSGTAINGDTEAEVYPNSGISAAVLNDYYFNTTTGDIFKCVKAGSPTVAIWSYVWNCFWDVTPDISLSIYRKEQNGSYVVIAEGIDNAVQNTDNALTFRDLHPSFNTCTYRIVATNTLNGGIGFVDLVENYEETSVIIQWNEVWNNVNKYDEDPNEVFEGCVLELPANVQLSDKNSNDVTLVEYIGRSRPVSYYGTQRGENPSISCAFPKEDTERLALLRQLMAYQGNVYIREPSGLGYWANVSVSYNKNYSDLTIPVTIDIKPVEGGM